MQFNDVAFAVFLPIVFSVYWLALKSKTRTQNIWILLASYLFYGWWDWRFLGLIMLTTISTFFSAFAANSRFAKTAATSNMLLNLGILILFKYFNFFSENLSRLFSLFGWNLDWFSIEVLLPVGISFYTFQAIGYTIDAYKKRVPICRDPIAFATFIAYFPQLVAGPIESASTLLPQIQKPRQWNTAFATTGLRMILFGLMKKVCLADMLAIYVEHLYTGGLESPARCLAAGILFSLEIYCDFSAYSEIARGVSRLFGIELMANFRFPYFSRNILEFWRRWHISLMLWFRNYLYIPLGGNRKGARRTAVNMIIVFLLSGLWHGAAWNFIAWSAYWAVAYVIGRFLLHLARKDSDISWLDLPEIAVTFGVVAFGFFIFRCSGWSQIACGFRNIWIYLAAFAALWVALKAIVNWKAVRITAIVAMILSLLLAAGILLHHWEWMLKCWWLLPAALTFAIEWRCRNMEFPLQKVPSRRWTRLALYWICLIFIVISEPAEMAFIYFQF